MVENSIQIKTTCVYMFALSIEWGDDVEVCIIVERNKFVFPCCTIHQNSCIFQRTHEKQTFISRMKLNLENSQKNTEILIYGTHDCCVKSIVDYSLVFTFRTGEGKVYFWRQSPVRTCQTQTVLSVEADTSFRPSRAKLWEIKRLII